MGKKCEEIKRIIYVSTWEPLSCGTAMYTYKAVPASFFFSLSESKFVISSVGWQCVSFCDSIGFMK